MSLDAALGSSRMGYQVQEVSFSSRDTEGCVLVRLVGATLRAYSGTRLDLSQRAKVGYCTYGTRATHVAPPPSFIQGEYDDLEVTVGAL